MHDNDTYTRGIHYSAWQHETSLYIRSVVMVVMESMLISGHKLSLANELSVVLQHDTGKEELLNTSS